MPIYINAIYKTSEIPKKKKNLTSPIWLIRKVLILQIIVH